MGFIERICSICGNWPTQARYGGQICIGCNKLVAKCNCKKKKAPKYTKRRRK